MKRRCLSRILMAISLLLMASPVQAASAENIVAFRQSVMQLLDGHIAAIKDIVQGNVDYTEHAAAHAISIEQLSTKLHALFPPSTGPDDLATGALQNIWTNDAAFGAAAQALRQEATQLVAAAESGDQLAVVASFNDLRRNGCDACHNAFRRRPSQ